MRKAAIALIIVMALVLTVSCSNNAEDSLCWINFSSSRARGLSAYIDYPMAESLTWNITATKVDNGSTTGQGTMQNVLLTDTFGPFSAGRWAFALAGFNSSGRLIFTGNAETKIGKGTNTVDVPMTFEGDTGSLTFTGCNFPEFIDGVMFNSFNVVIDGQQRLSFSSAESEKDGNYWYGPDKTVGLSAGIHDVTIRLGGSESRDVASFKIRIEPSLTTYVTQGTFEGRAFFNVIIDQKEAICE